MFGFDTVEESSQISLLTNDIEEQISNINGDVTYWLPYEESRGLWRRFDNGKRYCSEHSLECSAKNGQCGASPMITTCTLRGGAIPDFSNHLQHEKENFGLLSNDVLGNNANEFVGNLEAQLSKNFQNLGNDLTANFASILIASLTGDNSGNLDNAGNGLTENLLNGLIGGLTEGLGENSASDFADNLDNNLDKLLGNVNNLVGNLESNLDNLDSNFDNILANLDKDVLANLASSFAGNPSDNLFTNLGPSGLSNWGYDDHSNFGYTVCANFEKR